ncbi:MAG: ABC transporter permease [Opitutae bacterium]|nr:ABC transporter permease [Opitutae bacterium]
MINLRFLIRSLARTPFLTAVVILSLAVGIGANTVVFGWLRNAIVRPLPGADSPLVMSLEVKDDTGNWVSTSWREYQDLCAMVPSVAAISAQRPRSFYLGNTERDARAFGEFVSANFFETLALQPQQGRFFHADEVAAAGGAPVVVISHDFWRKQFAGAADVVGRQLKLNGALLTIIGVAPRGFQGGYNALAFDVWLPATLAPVLQPATEELTSRTSRPYTMLVQLRPGVPLAQVQGELDAAAHKLLATYPETNRGLGYGLLPLWRSPRGGQIIVISLATLQAFALLILAVVCINTANLLLARASTRQREIGVRLAVGGAPSRILLQLLAESVVLAFIGAASGLLCALWGVEAVKNLPLPSGGGLPVKIAPELDWTALVFAGGIATACGILFGLAPAWQLVRADVLQALRGGHSSSRRSWLRDALVATEVGAALVVLVLAALFYQSFRHALAADTGFDAPHIMLANVDLAGRGYTEANAHAFLEETLRRLRETPGVVAAGAASKVPLDVIAYPRGVFAVEGKPFDPNWKALYCDVTPGYLAAMGLTITEGTDLAPLARRDLPFDAVVNEAMAQRYWPEGSPVGHRFIINDTTFVVAGVVRNAKYENLNEAPKPMAWLTMRRQLIFAPTLHVRTSGDPRAILGALRQTVHAIDPEVALLDTRTFATHVDNSLVLQRMPARMLAVLAPLSLALAAIGLYAVIAYSLAQRMPEIGIRLALGATPSGVVRLMIWEGLRVVLVGAGIGWVFALAIGYALRAQFIGIRFGDPLIYGGVPALLLAVATLACWLPARRAAHIDPMVALRAE